MTLPREVVPGRDYMITRRCAERRFLLRPDHVTNNSIYCPAVMATLIIRESSDSPVVVMESIQYRKGNDLSSTIGQRDASP